MKEAIQHKFSMKQQIEEYEKKILGYINELEAQSKRHIKEINEIHDQYVNFKSQAAELQTRVSIYQADQ